MYCQINGLLEDGYVGPETLYHRDDALLYIAYICNAYLERAYPW